VTPVAGHPAHAVVRFICWPNQHGAVFTTWFGACGATGTAAGHPRFTRAASVRSRELCPRCFPHGHATTHPDPVEELR